MREHGACFFSSIHPPSPRGNAGQQRYSGELFPASPHKGDAPFSLFRMTGLRTPVPYFSGTGEGGNPHRGSTQPCPLPVLFPSVGAIPKSISSYFEDESYFINNQRHKNSLKHAGFSQAIHIFFSSQKNVNRLKNISVPLGSDFVLFPSHTFPSTSSPKAAARRRPWRSTCKKNEF